MANAVQCDVGRRPNAADLFGVDGPSTRSFANVRPSPGCATWPAGSRSDSEDDEGSASIECSRSDDSPRGTLSRGRVTYNRCTSPERSGRGDGELPERPNGLA